MNVLLPGALILGVVAIAFGILIRRMLPSAAMPQNDSNWFEDFSVATYAPMERLLSEEDVEFLRSQPGFQPKMEGRFRTQRRALFRAYLRNLGRDFQRLHRAARVMVLHAPEDRPDLAAALMKQNLLFWSRMGLAHGRLFLAGFGIGTVPVHELVAAVAAMQRQVQAVALSPSAP